MRKVKRSDPFHHKALHFYPSRSSSTVRTFPGPRPGSPSPPSTRYSHNRFLLSQNYPFLLVTLSDLIESGRVTYPQHPLSVDPLSGGRPQVSTQRQV